MAVRCLRDIYQAFEEGRFYSQYIYKTAGSSYTTQWAPAHFQAGKPSADPLVGGEALTFVPCVAQKNKAIYFPDIPEGQERYLFSVTLRPYQSTFNSYPSIVIYDLLGYYPMISGDDDTEQVLDNTESLPRYTDGVGVQLMIVCHVTAPLQHGVAVINFEDNRGQTANITVAVPNNGLNMVCSAVRSTAGSDTGAIGIPLGNGSQGVKKVNSIRFTTLPSGMFALCLVRVLGTMVAGDNGLAAEKIFYTHNGCHMPRIYDGAYITWASRIGGSTGRTVTWYGDFTFIWG